MDRNQELEEQVRRLTETVDGMRGRMARLEGREATSEAVSKGSDRRGFLRLGVGAVLGALGWAAVKAVPASAATGGPVLLGCANLAENPTTLAGDSGNPVPILSAADQGFFSAAQAAAGAFAAPLQGRGPGRVADPAVSAEGVDGWAGGTMGFGVYGLTDAGFGVVGEADTGVGLYARRSGRILQDGIAGTVAPPYTPNLFEQVRDAAGVLWIHNAGGVPVPLISPVIWRRVNTLRVDTADGAGGAFKPLRLYDSRTGTPRGPFVSGYIHAHTVAGQGAGAQNIPADAIAVTGNITAVSFTQNGFLTIFPAGAAYDPNADPSSMNFSAGQYAIANSFVCGLTAGQLKVFVGVFGATKANYIIDITGYLQ